MSGSQNKFTVNSSLTRDHPEVFSIFDSRGRALSTSISGVFYYAGLYDAKCIGGKWVHRAYIQCGQVLKNDQGGNVHRGFFLHIWAGRENAPPPEFMRFPGNLFVMGELVIGVAHEGIYITSPSSVTVLPPSEEKPYVIPVLCVTAHADPHNNEEVPFVAIGARESIFSSNYIHGAYVDTSPRYVLHSPRELFTARGFLSHFEKETIDGQVMHFPVIKADRVNFLKDSLKVTPSTPSQPTSLDGLAGISECSAPTNDSPTKRLRMDSPVSPSLGGSSSDLQTSQ